MPTSVGLLIILLNHFCTFISKNQLIAHFLQNKDNETIYKLQMIAIKPKYKTKQYYKKCVTQKTENKTYIKH